MLRRKSPGIGSEQRSQWLCSRSPLFTPWSTLWLRRSFTRHRAFCVQSRPRRSEPPTTSSEGSKSESLAQTASTTTNRRMSVTTVHRSQFGWHIKPRDGCHRLIRELNPETTTIRIKSRIMTRERILRSKGEAIGPQSRASGRCCATASLMRRRGRRKM